jgi:hypothetical protein
MRPQQRVMNSYSILDCRHPLNGEYHYQYFCSQDRIRTCTKRGHLPLMGHTPSPSVLLYYVASNQFRHLTIIKGGLRFRPLFLFFRLSFVFRSRNSFGKEKDPTVSGNLDKPTNPITLLL